MFGLLFGVLSRKVLPVLAEIPVAAALRYSRFNDSPYLIATLPSSSTTRIRLELDLMFNETTLALGSQNLCSCDAFAVDIGGDIFRIHCYVGGAGEYSGNSYFTDTVAQDQLVYVVVEADSAGIDGGGDTFRVSLNGTVVLSTTNAADYTGFTTFRIFADEALSYSGDFNVNRVLLESAAGTDALASVFNASNIPTNEWNALSELTGTVQSKKFIPSDDSDVHSWFDFTDPTTVNDAHDETGGVPVDAGDVEFVRNKGYADYDISKDGLSIYTASYDKESLNSRHAAGFDHNTDANYEIDFDSDVAMAGCSIYISGVFSSDILSRPALMLRAAGGSTTFSESGGVTFGIGQMPVSGSDYAPDTFTVLSSNATNDASTVIALNSHDTGAHVLEAHLNCDTQEIEFYVDGVYQGSDTASQTNGTITFGRIVIGTNIIRAGEVVVCSALKTALERVRIREFMENKIGLA